MVDKMIGLRREDKNRWETRTPLLPEDVRELRETYGIQTAVQPSPRRIFNDLEYTKVGALISERLDTPFIFGIKEIPLEVFEKDRIYIFFSHTIKGQPYNMPMLKKMIELKDSLIDYERIVDENGKRMIAFGKFAGIAGMIDTLWALGKRWEREGYRSPFLDIRRAYEYRDVKEFQEQAGIIARQISSQKILNSLKPVIIGVAGYGNVAGGVQQVLGMLPMQDIEPADISHVSSEADKIYKVVFKEEHMVERIDGKKFDLQDYYKYPEGHRSIFAKYIPFLTVLVNCIYWEKKYPRLLTQKWLRENSKQIQKLKVIGDISCDLYGTIEVTSQMMAPDDAGYCYDPETDTTTPYIEGKGVYILAVDILPTELPRESSCYFSSKLKPLVIEIAKAQYPKNIADCTLPMHLKRAMILYNGELTSDYKYLQNHLK